MTIPIIISVGSGKGGVGKSSIISNIGAVIAQGGHSVGFIDADLGAANLHLCLGVRHPKVGLQDYLAGRMKSIADIAVKTAVPNTWLISGASDILELANPRFSQKQKVINNLRKMEAEYIFIDLGGGTANNTIDFFTAFQYGIVVSDSLPTSIENAYGFLKNSIVRGIARLFPGRRDVAEHLHKFSDIKVKKGCATMSEFLLMFKSGFPQEAGRVKEWMASKRVFFIINMVKSGKDIEIGKRFVEVVRKYLNIRLNYIGYVISTPEVPQSVRDMRPLVVNKPSEEAFGCFRRISENLVKLTGR